MLWTNGPWSADLVVSSSSPTWGEFFSILHRAPLHTAFHYQPLIILIWMKYCWKGHKIALVSHPSICIHYLHLLYVRFVYSLIQKCQGGNKYVLPITVKFDQSTRRFGRISFARLFKLTKHIVLLYYLLSPYLLSCMRGSRKFRKSMHIIKTIMKFCVPLLEHRLQYDEFLRRWDSNSVSQAHN